MALREAPHRRVGHMHLWRLILYMLFGALPGCRDTVAPTVVPSPPSGVAVRVISHHAVELSWIAASSVASQYVVETTDEAATLHFDTIPVPQTSLVLDGLQAGTRYRWSVWACNVAGCSAGVEAEAVTLDLLSIANTVLPPGAEGEQYSVSLSAVGGRRPYSWTSVRLPPGLAMAEDGTVSGVPQGGGLLSVSVLVASADQQVATGEFFVPIAKTLRIAGTVLPTPITGESYSTTFRAEGSQLPYRWRLAEGSLPLGLGLDSAGVLSGTPVTAGRHEFVVSVAGQDGQTATAPFSLDVRDSSEVWVVVAPSILPPALVGNRYDVRFSAEGAVGNVTWSISYGELPPGLGLSTDGALQGQATEVGQFYFVLHVEADNIAIARDFSIRVESNGVASFDITRFDVDPVAEAISRAVDSAIERWARALTMDTSPVTVPLDFFDASYCFGFGPLLNGGSVDDLILIVHMAQIDGVGGVLAKAGPCGLRTSNMPFAGAMTLDLADAESLAGTARLSEIVLHEIGHVLGIGTLWALSDMVSGSGTNDPRFNGEQAVREFSVLGGNAAVPLEALGGAGTAEGHWRESTFGNELMTGFSEPLGVTLPLSRVTLGSLQDLGYVVDLSAADPYQLGPPLAAELMPAPQRTATDIPALGPWRVLPPGG